MLQGIFFSWSFFGSSEMRHQYHCTTITQYLVYCWNSRINACSICYIMIFVKRDIKINPDQGLLPAKIIFFKCFHILIF